MTTSQTLSPNTVSPFLPRKNRPILILNQSTFPPKGTDISPFNDKRNHHPPPSMFILRKRNCARIHLPHPPAMSATTDTIPARGIDHPDI
ncbi:MAG: hypothetical protein R3B93_23205 [Bacteroidia bacterium]